MYARTEKNGTNQVPTQYAECEKQQQTTTTTLFNTTVYSTKLCTQNRFCTADAVLQYTVVQRTSTSSDNGVPQCLNKIHIYIHRYTQYRHSLHTYIHTCRGNDNHEYFFVYKTAVNDILKDSRCCKLYSKLPSGIGAARQDNKPILRREVTNRPHSRGHTWRLPVGGPCSTVAWVVCKHRRRFFWLEPGASLADLGHFYAPQQSSRLLLLSGARAAEALLRANAEVSQGPQAHYGLRSTPNSGLAQPSHPRRSQALGRPVNSSKRRHFPSPHRCSCGHASGAFLHRPPCSAGFSTKVRTTSVSEDCRCLLCRPIALQ